jgi:hypothetical protein
MFFPEMVRFVNNDPDCRGSPSAPSFDWLDVSVLYHGTEIIQNRTLKSKTRLNRNYQKEAHAEIKARQYNIQHGVIVE